MKATNNCKHLIWAVIVLAVLNLATISSIIYHRYRPMESVVTDSQGQVQASDESIRYSGRFFREQLNLSREQMNWFSEYNPVFRQQIQQINAELSRKRYQMLEEMSASKSDTLKLNQLSDTIGILHASLKKVSFEYYLSLKQICDPDQQAKLELLFSEMFAGDEHMQNSGRGGPYGRQYGRRNRN